MNRAPGNRAVNNEKIAAFKIGNKEATDSRDATMRRTPRGAVPGGSPSSQEPIRRFPAKFTAFDQTPATVIPMSKNSRLTMMEKPGAVATKRPSTAIPKYNSK